MRGTICKHLKSKCSFPTFYKILWFFFSGYCTIVPQHFFFQRSYVSMAIPISPERVCTMVPHQHIYIGFIITIFQNFPEKYKSIYIGPSSTKVCSKDFPSLNINGNPQIIPLISNLYFGLINCNGLTISFVNGQIEYPSSLVIPLPLRLHETQVKEW